MMSKSSRSVPEIRLNIHKKDYQKPLSISAILWTQTTANLWFLTSLKYSNFPILAAQLYIERLVTRRYLEFRATCYSGDSGDSANRNDGSFPLEADPCAPSLLWGPSATGQQVFVMRNHWIQEARVGTSLGLAKMPLAQSSAARPANQEGCCINLCAGTTQLSVQIAEWYVCKVLQAQSLLVENSAGLFKQRIMRHQKAAIHAKLLNCQALNKIQNHLNC